MGVLLVPHYALGYMDYLTDKYRALSTPVVRSVQSRQSMSGSGVIQRRKATWKAIHCTFAAKPHLSPGHAWLPSNFSSSISPEATLPTSEILSYPTTAAISMATRRLISSGSAFEAQIGYSRAVVDGDFVFVSGCTG